MLGWRRDDQTFVANLHRLDEAACSYRVDGRWHRIGLSSRGRSRRGRRDNAGGPRAAGNDPGRRQHGAENGRVPETASRISAAEAETHRHTNRCNHPHSLAAGQAPEWARPRSCQAGLVDSALTEPFRGPPWPLNV